MSSSFGRAFDDGERVGPNWFERDLELKKTEMQLEKIMEVLEEQRKELRKAVENVEKDVELPEVHLGRKAASMLLVAEARARELGHRSIGTRDILWAMFHQEGLEESEAIKFLKNRGVSKESVYSSHKYSDNAGRIMKLAAGEAKRLKKPMVGTEDLLWALFQVDDHYHSRSQAVKHLETRGVNMDLVWGNAELSKVAKAAMQTAVARAKQRGDRVIGSEDLVEALFSEASKNNSHAAKNWLVTQHVVPITSPEGGDLRRALTGSSGLLLESDFVEQEGSDAFLRMFLVGGLAGTIETFLVQPLVYWKTISQVGGGASISSIAGGGGGGNGAISLWGDAWRPQVMYRGVFVNALSIGPISAFQYACNGVLSYLHHNYLLSRCAEEQQERANRLGAEVASSSSSSSSDFSDLMNDEHYRTTSGLAIAATTGALSSLIVTPAELLMISQQRSGLAFGRTVRQIWSATGAGGFFRGLGATAAREAGWTFGFLGLAPEMKRALRDDSKFFNNNEVAASLAASILAGQAAAILTQPFDTVKTLMQADRGIASRMRFGTGAAAAKHLFDTQGVGAFWRGLVPRSVRCVAAVFILGEVQQKLNSVFDAAGLLMPTDHSVGPPTGPPAAAAASAAPTTPAASG